MESITPISQIERAAQVAAQRHRDAAAVCPYPPHTEAERVFREMFNAARVKLLEQFIRELLNPEEAGYAVQPWVARRARELLCDRPSMEQMAKDLRALDLKPRTLSNAEARYP